MSVHRVDAELPLPRTIVLSLRHVFVMFAGAVAVPLIIRRALRFPPEHACARGGARA